MTTPPATSPPAESRTTVTDPDPAMIDGVNVDAVSRVVQACAGVAALFGGRFGEVASYLPGRRVPGVRVDRDAVHIQVKARWGATAHDLLSQISSVAAPLVGHRRVEIVVADIDDPAAVTGGAPLELEAADTAPALPAPSTLHLPPGPVSDTPRPGTDPHGSSPIAL
jgi:hypothetical protein